jgi:hypothetical protein
MVPLLIRWPGRIPAGQVCESLASNIDIMPTLLDLAGVEVPPEVDGRSLKCVALGQTGQARVEVICDLSGSALMLRQGDWKYNLNIYARGDKKGHQLDELYNLADDPWELNNLVEEPAQAQRAAAMRGRLLAWLDEIKHPYAATRQAAAVMPIPWVTPIRPVLDTFEDLGSGRVRVAYHWHVSESSDLPAASNTARIVQRVAKPRGNAVVDEEELVAMVSQPIEPAPWSWKPGQTPSVAMEMAFPADAAERKYLLRLGMTPVKGNVLLQTGRPNEAVVGELTLARTGGQTTVTLRKFRE